MEKKLKYWLENNLISLETYTNLLKDVKEEAEHRKKIGFIITLYTLGIILIGLGLFSFISANIWLVLLLLKSAALRIFLIVLLTFSSLFFGYKLAYEKQNYIKLGKALICLSSILIGCCYMVIAQAYNINAHSSFLLFLWCFSILPPAYIFKEKFINCLSSVLFILGFIMYYFELSLDHTLLWTIFMPVILGSLFYFAGSVSYIEEKYNEFAVFYKLIGLKAIFITLLILTCSSENSYNISSIHYYLPLFLILIGFLLNYFLCKNKNNLIITETAYFSVLLLALLSVMLLKTVNPVCVMIGAHIFLITMFYFAIQFGYKFENVKLISLIHSLIGIYLFTMYCRFGWSFLDKSLFFFLCGVILISMGIWFEKKRKKLLKGNNNE